MSFDTDAARDGIGRVIRVDVSTDRFATILARWGTKAGLLDGVNMYSARVLSLGAINRALGQQHIASGGSPELTLDNSDGALDGYVGRENMQTMARLRFKAYVVLFDPASPGVVTSKVLGEFSMTEWTRQDNSTLRMQLGDEVLGLISQQAALPTLLDWQAVGTTSNNPIKSAMGIPASISEQTPVQLAFGEDWVLAMPHLLPWTTPNPNYEDHVIVPICTTTDLGAVSQDLITSVRVQWMAVDVEEDSKGTWGERGPRLRDIQRDVVKYPGWGTTPPTMEHVWSVEKSPTITKDGHSFQIVYLVVKAHLGILMYSAAPGNWDTTWLGDLKYLGGYPTAAVDAASADTRVLAQRVIAWYVKGRPLSSTTQTSIAVQHPCDVAKDLVAHYSNNTAITINDAARLRTKAANPSAACAGIVQSWTQGPKKGEPMTFEPPPSLRQTITKLCQSSDMDVFIDWSGRLSFCSDAYDFTTATQGSALPEFRETECVDVQRWTPSIGERGSPFNRLFFTGARGSPADALDAPYQGPFDYASGYAGIDIADRVVEASIEQGWRPYRQTSVAPFQWRTLDIVARDRISFKVGLRGLLIDIGDYFKFSWARGSLSGPYASSIFQCEAITYNPGDDSVQIEAVWRDDSQTERQYLLDDETLLVRSKGALTGAGAWDAGNGWFAFGGTINLLTMGVQVGDILVLRDSTEAADSFLRNACFRIDTVTAGYCEILPVMTSTVSVANADWSIVRGATTYPTVVSDPSNYPSGGSMYGKVTAAAGTTSDAATGNRLISG